MISNRISAPVDITEGRIVPAGTPLPSGYKQLPMGRCYVASNPPAHQLLPDTVMFSFVHPSAAQRLDEDGARQSYSLHPRHHERGSLVVQLPIENSSIQNIARAAKYGGDHASIDLRPHTIPAFPPVGRYDR